MSGYGEMARDEQQVVWIDKWVFEERAGEPIDEEQYRYTLARARAAESELEVLRSGLRAFSDLIVRAGF